MLQVHQRIVRNFHRRNVQEAEQKTEQCTANSVPIDMGKLLHITGVANSRSIAYISMTSHCLIKRRQTEQQYLPLLVHNIYTGLGHHIVSIATCAATTGQFHHVLLRTAWWPLYKSCSISASCRCTSHSLRLAACALSSSARDCATSHSARHI